MESTALFDCSPTYVEQPVALPKSTQRRGKGTLLIGSKGYVFYVIFLRTFMLYSCVFFSCYKGIIFHFYKMHIIPCRVVSHDQWFRH